VSVYVDTMRDTKPWQCGEEACHLYADSLPELLKFAGRLGLAPGWLHAVAGFPHFDLTRRKRREAIAAGAIEVSQQESVQIRRHTPGK